MIIKNLFFALLLLICVSAIAPAQNQTIYLNYPQISCIPNTCNLFEFIGYGGYGSVYVLGQGSCQNGIRPYVNPSQVGLNCTIGSSTELYAYAYVASFNQFYYINGQQIYAQQLEGQNGTYSYIGGNWVNLFAGNQFNDCYTGALRTFEPNGRPC